jgi:two-component system sensor histidine kinase AlgZ
MRRARFAILSTPMSTPTRPTEPSTLWPPTQHGEAPRTSSFGATPVAAAGPASLFDVCHTGVVLRAVIGVHVAVAVGVMFVSSGFVPWLIRFAAAAGVALPGVLAWLLVACAARQPLGRLPLAGQWAAAVGLGAASGLLGALLWWAAGLEDADASFVANRAAPALAGALGGATLFHWLRLRSKAALPAETTARLAELQSRIRPHFLFNTLNTALALVRVDPARAEGVLEDLAELFRVALQDTSASVSLADEIELARRYLAIEQIRFGARLAVQWDLDPSAGAARVPPLLLQPLVENAVRHGIEPADAGGTIRVRTQVRGGRAVVAIDNTVSGNASVPGAGIALANVRDRLALMHDVAGEFDARLEPGRYRVRIGVPLPA